MYSLRAADAAGALEGFACAADAPPSPPLTVSLFPADGFRDGAAYAPVLLLGEGSYALASISIRDARGTELLPRSASGTLTLTLALSTLTLALNTLTLT